MQKADYIDNYCERTSALFWAEPLNAVTNLAFLIAAYFAYKYWKAKGAGEKDILVLIWILATVGLGSFLFHTFAQGWSMLADVIPIAFFIYLAIFSASLRVFGRSKLQSILIVSVFFAFNALCERYIPSDLLNGSIMYLPAFLALLTMTFLARAKNLQAHKAFLNASILFIISLTFRSLDSVTCEYTPAQLGTHFMWHILNGLLMFNIIKGLLLGEVRKP